MLAAMATAVLVAPGAAQAEPPQAIAIELHVGDRPAVVGRWLSPVLAELEARQVATDQAATGDRYAREVSFAAQPAVGLPADFPLEVEAGYRAWINGDFTRALAIVTPLVEVAQQNPGAIVANPRFREALLRALVAKALAHARAGQEPDARATFRAIMRGFPDARLSRSLYGPEAAALFDDERKTQLARPPGQLTVTAPDASAVVFVDEKFDQVGSFSGRELPPGLYRVYVQRGAVASRVHVAEVQSGGVIAVAIDWDYDAAVRTADNWAGFVFPGRAQLDKHRVEYATRFAGELHATRVVALEITGMGSSRQLVGTVIDVAHHAVVRRAHVALDPDPSVARLRAFADDLAADGEPAHPVTASVEATDESIHDAGGGHGWGRWKWVAGTVAVGAIGAGTTMLVLDGRCVLGAPANQVCDVYSTQAAGLVTLGAGLGVGVLATYLFVHDHHRAHAAIAVTPAAGGAFASATWRY